MAELYNTGRIIDVILALVAMEVLVLVALHRRTSRGIAPRVLLPVVFSGVFLLLAVRCALVAAEWPWIGACLLAAMLAHGVDLLRRAGG